MLFYCDDVVVVLLLIGFLLDNGKIIKLVCIKWYLLYMFMYF